VVRIKMDMKEEDYIFMIIQKIMKMNEKEREKFLKTLELQKGLKRCE
jgi:hypothetical protein